MNSQTPAMDGKGMTPVKVRIGKGALTRDLVWCECGRGLSLTGKWSFCPNCGHLIDQASYQSAVAEAANDIAPYLNPKDESDILAELTRLRARNERLEACVKAGDALKPWLLRPVQLEQQIEVEKVEKAYDEARAGLEVG